MYVDEEIVTRRLYCYDCHNSNFSSVKCFSAICRININNVGFNALPGA
jgi:hypothetical protein